VLAQTIDAERADPQAAERLAAARDVARVGGALIERLGSRADESPGAVVSLLLTVARASYELWQGDDDRVALDDAVRLFQRVLERDASSRNALRGLALAADDAGLEDVALDAWRRLVAGEEPGSTAWFDAKTRQLELLAQLEPRRAAEALEQFTVLYPSFGPEPYATRLRELRDRLERQGARPSEPAPGVDEP
jgi:tetratricopeptide (TPR) repeat protein